MTTKKKMVLIILTFFLILIIGTLVVFFFLIKGIDQFSWTKEALITTYVDKHTDELEQYLEGSLDLKKALTLKHEPPSKGCNEESCYVKFPISHKKNPDCTNGFYYSEQESPHRFEHLNASLKKDGEFSYQLNDEEKTILSFIKKHWYYYESCKSQ